jgi:hypothetical protein
MADPSPTDGPEGQEPEDAEGQEPDADVDDKDEAAKSEPRTYSEAYVKQLRREASSYRTKLTSMEGRLRELEDRDKSEQDKLAERVTAAEARAVEAETRLLRLDVAREHGLDLDAAAFLTGSTREEVELRAEELAKLLKDKAKPSAGFDGGARQTVPEKGPPEQEHNDFLMRALGRAPTGRGT